MIGEWCNGSTPDSGSGNPGSNPGSPASKKAPSTRGQGRHPLKVETRVRIPLGLPL